MCDSDRGIPNIGRVGMVGRFIDGCGGLRHSSRVGGSRGITSVAGEDILVAKGVVMVADLGVVRILHPGALTGQVAGARRGGSGSRAVVK